MDNDSLRFIELTDESSDDENETLPLIAETCEITPIMDFRNSLRVNKFKGYSSENASKFLAEFQSYAVLNQLEGNNNQVRKIAAFQLHLDGPSFTWFVHLDNANKDTWDHVVEAFNNKYVLGNNNPALITEAELFQKLKLQPQQPIEEYHGQIIESGLKLGKPERDILSKFIDGLPDKLSFFVSAGNPADHNAALLAAQRGEALNYRLQPEVNAATLKTPIDSDELLKLKQEVEFLREKLHTMQRPSSTVHCSNCGGRGHDERQCRYRQNPVIRCYRCGIRGHKSNQCRQLPQRQGNDYDLRENRRSRLGRP